MTSPDAGVPVDERPQQRVDGDTRVEGRHPTTAGSGAARRAVRAVAVP